MPFKVLSTSPSFGFYVSEPVEYLQDHGCEVDVMPQGKSITEAQLVGLVGQYDGMIVGVERVTAAVIEAAKRAKVIAKHGAGVDNIGVEAATKRGIVVLNAPAANADAVADLTIGLLLSAARLIPFADRAIRGGEWPRVVGVQLSGKTLGIIGLGQIGKKVACRAQGFEMKVLAYDLMRDEHFAEQWGVEYVSMEEVLERSDFISLHIPLKPTTRRMIGKHELGLMKRGVCLVNISRGDIVDEEALYRALKEGHIRAAALDVFAQEPPKGSPLLGLHNVIATPHMGGYTYEALGETGMICVRGIVAVFEGRRPEGVVNPDVLRSIV